MFLDLPLSHSLMHTTQRLLGLAKHHDATGIAIESVNGMEEHSPGLMIALLDQPLVLCLEADATILSRLCGNASRFGDNIEMIIFEENRDHAFFFVAMFRKEAKS